MWWHKTHSFAKVTDFNLSLSDLEVWAFSLRVKISRRKIEFILTLKDHIRNLWSWQRAKIKESSSSSLTVKLRTRSNGLCSPRIAVGIHPDSLCIMELLFSSRIDTPPERKQPCLTATPGNLKPWNKLKYWNQWGALYPVCHVAAE